MQNNMLLNYIPTGIGANENRNFELVDIRFRERVGYNDMSMAPMTTDFSNETLLRRLANTDIGGNVVNADFNGLAHALVKPKLGGAIANIANGWGEKRGMFFMTIRERQPFGNQGSRIKHIFVGFTDNFDLTFNKDSLSDDLRLTFNHAFTFRDTEVATGFGGSTIESILLSSHQIFSHNYAAKRSYRVTKDRFGVRPCDVFSRIQSSGMAEGLLPNDDYAIDPRIDIGTTTELKFSDMVNNNNPASYLKKTLRALDFATSNEMDTEEYPTVDNTLINAYELSAESESNIGGNDSPASQFLRDITINHGEYTSRGYITLSDLRRYFGDRFNHLMSMDNVISKNSEKGTATVKALIANMQSWKSKTMQTEIALILGFSVPTYMLRCGIMEYGFISTNDVSVSLAGTTGFITKPLPTESGFGAAKIQMFSRSFDTARQGNLFHHYIETELLRVLSKNSQQKLLVEVRSSLCGDSVIKVMWGNEPAEEFVIPTFCDSLFGPMTTNSLEDLTHIASDVNEYSINKESLLKTHDGFSKSINSGFGQNSGLGGGFSTPSPFGTNSDRGKINVV